MTIRGTVDHIRYRNDDNGYSIVILDCHGEPVVTVGCFPFVSEGDEVEVTGEYVTHPKFGNQFKASSVAAFVPTTSEGVIRFLCSPLVRGVGEKTAIKIVNKFKEKSIDVILNSPSDIAAISGIGAKRAREIREDVAAASLQRDAIIFMAGYGITTGMALKICETYKSETISVLQTNPYRLIEDVRGVGFLTADTIAKKLGIGENSVFRLRAGLIHTLRVSEERDGNTYLPKEVLFEEAAKILHSDALDEALEDLVLDRKVKNIDGKIALSGTYRCESDCAKQLINLLEASNKIKPNTNHFIEQFETLNAIKLHETQADAVRMAVTAGVSVITGGPGTGKTTIIRCVLYVLNALNQTYRLLAPTGRAAKRMEESTGEAASTIHRAVMAYDKEKRDQEGEDRRLREDCIIVDEFSMVDVFLLRRLLAAIGEGSKLIIVGDSDQLPSVGAGNVLDDIMASGLVSVTRLTHVYRQAEESLIVMNAHAINKGIMPDLSRKDKDFFWFNVKSPEAIADMAVELVTTRVPQFAHLPPERVQVLCAMKNGAAGVFAVNRRLQQLLNKEGGKTVLVGDYEIKSGDRVMHIVNDYNMEWERGAEYGVGVFNGDSGMVTAITPSLDIEVTFDDGRKCVYTGEQKKELILSYAITVHKSQGSEFDAVVIPVVGGSPNMMTRNLLYTAITRAKKMAVLVGEKYHIQKMIENTYVSQRFTLLQELLTGIDSDFRKLYGDMGK